MNLQLYQWGLVCTEGSQRFFVYLYLLFLLTFYTDLISGLQEQNFLLQNPSSGCQVPAAVAGIAYSLRLFVLPQAHMLKLRDVGMPMSCCTEILSFL